MKVLNQIKKQSSKDSEVMEIKKPVEDVKERDVVVKKVETEENTITKQIEKEVISTKYDQLACKY